ncbi:GNAT family N-acetyltransferase [Telmatobacter sp. DSM 110680]|uniref:GNAT family N-acetyltransferase n=1 Tax=Telmatobacter sp. DSM 110680 TaxID=3036704 RepID=A0AAU7DGS3_9BACT
MRIPHLTASLHHLVRMALRRVDTDVAAPDFQLQEADESLLDNPILHALLSDHRLLAQIDGQARRYPAEIGPLAGIPEQSQPNYDSLRTLAGSGGLLGLFLNDEPALPEGWALFRGGTLTQMICRGLELAETQVSTHEFPEATMLRRLVAPDVPAMLELARLTEPGPFRERTIELGNFYGIFEGERLMAMAGQRTRVPGFVEVSAVCTHPDARGRGYGGRLMREVMRDIFAEQRSPYLHAFADNPAVRLYRSLGFTQRRTFHLAIIKNEK